MDRTLIKIETDIGLEGYGEVGSNGQTVRGQLHQIEDLLLGEDPIAVDKLYDRMMGQQHSHRPHVPTVGGVDIALWDLAGKIFDRLVSKLLTGRFREEVPLYLNSRPDDTLDPESCQEWADSRRDDPDGPTAVKVGVDHVIDAQSPARGDESRRSKRTLTGTELEQVRRAVENVRDALSWELDFIVHCHNE